MAVLRFQVAAPYFLKRDSGKVRAVGAGWELALSIGCRPAYQLLRADRIGGSRRSLGFLSHRGMLTQRRVLILFGRFLAIFFGDLSDLLTLRC